VAQFGSKPWLIPSESCVVLGHRDDAVNSATTLVSARRHATLAGVAAAAAAVRVAYGRCGRRGARAGWRVLRPGAVRRWKSGVGGEVEEVGDAGRVPAPVVEHELSW